MTCIVRLAGVMYQSMGLDASSGTWQRAASEALRARLGRDVAVFVVDDPDTPGVLAASVTGTLARRLPSPRNPDAIAGYIQWVATDPRRRRSGCARAVMTCLLAWFRQAGVRAVELHATSGAEHLYRSLGFGEGPLSGP
jgi:GNAT superfamily N-acetyltransferase